MKRKFQKGSLLIEMIAVIGLLTLITPILFQQVHRRNEEVINAQIATEMRWVKDAVTSYLEAEEEAIAHSSAAYWTDGTGANQTQALWDGTRYGNVDLLRYKISQSDLRNKIDNYMTGTFAQSETILADYDIFIFGYTLRTACSVGNSDDDCDFRPVLFGLIVENSNSYSPNLRRKAKTAALIGAEGGVVQFSKGIITGMQGTWSIPVANPYGSAPANSDGKYAVAAVTFFNNIASSSVLKDVQWQHLKAVTAQADTIAAKRIAAKELFSIGGDTENCIQHYGEKNQAITSHAVSPNCQPFFEIDPVTKEVRTPFRIRSGVETTTFYCGQLRDQTTCQLFSAKGCSWKAATSASPREWCQRGSGDTQPITVKCSDYAGTDATKKASCIAAPGCYPLGSSCYSCSGWGSKHDCQTLARGCAWVVDKDGNGSCVGEYMVDPTAYSVMNHLTVTDDIILSGHRNRKLSDSLSNQVFIGTELACWVGSKNIGSATNPNYQYYTICNGGTSSLGGKCCSWTTSNGTTSCNPTTSAVWLQYSTCATAITAAKNTTNFPNSYTNDGADVRAACKKYCTNVATLGLKADNGNDANIDQCPDFDTPAGIICGKWGAVQGACHAVCGALYATEKFGSSSGSMTRNALISQMELYTKRFCELAHGKCYIKYEKQNVCPDSQNFASNLVASIRHMDSYMSTSTTAEYENLVYTVNMAGAVTVDLNEYCLLKPED